MRRPNSQVALSPYGEKGLELTGRVMSLTSQFMSKVKEANSQAAPPPLTPNLLHMMHLSLTFLHRGLGSGVWVTEFRFEN